MSCQILAHRNNVRLSDLPDNQGGAQRHKCCGCTYELGFQDGLNNAGRRQINWDEIEESQAGYSRHKDAAEAYLLGFADGSQQRRSRQS